MKNAILKSKNIINYQKTNMMFIMLYKNIKIMINYSY